MKLNIQNIKHLAILFLHFTINSKFLKSGSQLTDTGNSQDRFFEWMVPNQVFQFNQKLEKKALVLKKHECKIKLGIVILLSMKSDNGQMG